ncbi:MAG: hypothetical protein J5640_00595 [Bacteroidales bacterium]|nr:hypothetical protein [Bacteroidales bacterium]
MRRFLICLSVLLTGAGALSAQDYMVPELEAHLRGDLMRAGGNLMPYTPGDMHDTPAPRGYKPFYISHYSRHGSRHTWGDSQFAGVIDVCRKADSLGILNEKGRKIWKEAELVREAWGGMDGRLAPRGVEEHADMARRMLKRFPAVFRGSPHIRAISSTVQRSIISMTGFCTAMSAERPGTRWHFDTGERFMKYIGDTGTVKPDMSEAKYKVKHRNWNFTIDTCYVLGRIFTDSLAAAALIPDVAKFNSWLYDTGTITRCWDIDDYILPEMPFELLYAYFSNEGHYTFAKYGNSEYSGPRIASATRIVDDIVAKADEAIAGGEYAADLRFGHDFPLQVLVSYLGVEGPGSRATFDEVDKYYWRSRDLCMGSNLQMIFYRNKKGHVLVKFLYQEQERRLCGLESVSGPYYDWDTVKANIEFSKR